MDEAFIALIVIFLACWGLIDIFFEIANLITKIIKRKEKRNEKN